MNDGIAKGLGGGSASRVHERADDEKTTQDQAERWASLLGLQLAAITPNTIPSQPTSAWHSGDGDLTPGSGSQLTDPASAAGLASGTGEAAHPGQNRLIIRVDGGDLGEVALVVDRKEGAIRVTIGAADAGAEAALGLERAGLMRALHNQGIAVDSVNVVRASKFGTVLAPLGSKTTQRNREASEAESKDDEHARRRLARKLNLIG
jgi:flagellar hook-length control protein FliK